MKFKRITIMAVLALSMTAGTAYAEEYGNYPESEYVQPWGEEYAEPWEAVEQGFDAPQVGSEVPQDGSYEVAYTAEELMFQGVIEHGGNTWTWYSQNVLPGDGLTELNANGRTVDGSGYVVDGDGYIAIASPNWDEPVGTVVLTPFGMGRVYDYCASGAYDVYTAW